MEVAQGTGPCVPKRTRLGLENALGGVVEKTEGGGGNTGGVGKSFALEMVPVALADTSLSHFFIISLLELELLGKLQGYVG